MKTATIFTTTIKPLVCGVEYFLLLSGPFQGHKHVVASTINNKFACETMLFEADEHGRVKNYTDLHCERDELKLKAVMGRLGYTVYELVCSGPFSERLEVSSDYGTTWEPIAIKHMEAVGSTDWRELARSQRFWVRRPL